MLRDFFDNIKQRLNISGKLALENTYTDSVSKYYVKTSRIYFVLSFFTLVLLVLFVFFALIFNVKNITYDKFYYFIKDLDTILSSEDFSSFSVDYNYDSNRSYEEYKGGFTTVGKSSLTVYSATGYTTGEFYHQYSSPKIKSSSKYFILYDHGGTEFSIYNSFSRLYTETLSSPIVSAEICDNGDFIVVTSDGDYKSIVYYYDNNFRCVGVYYYVDYVTAVSLSEDGKHMLVSCSDTLDGGTVSNIFYYKTDDASLYENEKSEPKKIVVNEKSVIITCGFMKLILHIGAEKNIPLFSLFVFVFSGD